MNSYVCGYNNVGGFAFVVRRMQSEHGAYRVERVNSNYFVCGSGSVIYLNSSYDKALEWAKNMSPDVNLYTFNNPIECSNKLRELYSGS